MSLDDICGKLAKATVKLLEAKENAEFNLKEILKELTEKKEIEKGSIPTKKTYENVKSKEKRVGRIKGE